MQVFMIYCGRLGLHRTHLQPDLQCRPISMLSMLLGTAALGDKRI
jgi:hypothetical protein